MATNLCAVVFFMLSFVNSALLQGSGTNGKLRLCVVRGRGVNRPAKYCPTLDNEPSGIECVLGTDRLDCLRRISKGKVDFGMFSPEDLVAARWANVDVLVTNEIRLRNKTYERSVVAVINKRIPVESAPSLNSMLRNATLCHPGVGVEDIRPVSDTISAYLENLIIPRSCDPKLSLAENRVKALADFFGPSCKAGPWVLDSHRDAQLKSRYSSLCAACDSTACEVYDRYRGNMGALECLQNRGDVTWAEHEDVITYFGLKVPNEATNSIANMQYLCQDGTVQPLNTAEPCVWMHLPWPVLVSTRKTAVAVADIAMSLTNTSVLVDRHWHGALAHLLELHQSQSQPLQPPMTPLDYLATAKGFREAYSQSGCDPPRHVTLCTSNNLERNKCEWLSEAAAVYGIVPALQCTIRPDLESCMQAAAKDEAVVLANSDWLLKGMRDYSLQPLLHEVTQIIDQTHTVVAYVRSDSAINKMADLRGKRAFFPEYDGFAWHAVLRYITKKNDIECHEINGYFSDICAPGFERANASSAAKSLTGSCYKEGGVTSKGELQALRALIEGKGDVAFISMQTIKMYEEGVLSHHEWANGPKVEIKPVCPEENTEYCFISWSNLGHVFASRNATAMRKQEIVNVFEKLDEHFGKRSSSSVPMFLMYGPFDDNMDVIFHNNTRNLVTPDVMLAHQYAKIPLSYERGLSNSTDSCLLNFGANLRPSILPMVCLVLYLLSSQMSFYG